jgi:Niemann-Pick C1 protein
MTYHTVLRTSADYIQALKQARLVADNITRMLNEGGQTNYKSMTELNDNADAFFLSIAETDSSHYEVFPYSVFYVFYEQYLTMWRDTLQSLGISFVTIFVVTFLLTGFDIYAALIIELIVVMIVTNIGGLMYFWNVSLNAISLVNLVMVSSYLLKLLPAQAFTKL